MRYCIICKKSFEPKRENQITCLSKRCQHERRLGNIKKWREKNPYYLEEYAERFPSGYSAWQSYRRERMRKWRNSHKKKILKYKKNHIQKIRDYMRKYMQAYRERKRMAL